MGDITVIISKVESGEASKEELLAVVYDELRKLARSKMARERKGHTLQATALVHEAWLNLEKSSQERWEGRRHFFGAAAQSMRRILIDHARRKLADKRGGGDSSAEFEESAIRSEVPDHELLAVHEVLEELEEEEPQTAELVKLRYFIGLSMQETADALGVKKRTAEGIWQYGRVWLSRRLKGDS